MLLSLIGCQQHFELSMSATLHYKSHQQIKIDSNHLLIHYLSMPKSAGTGHTLELEIAPAASMFAVKLAMPTPSEHVRQQIARNISGPCTARSDCELSSCWTATF